MKWTMDVHKYISETTRKALQVLVSRGITSHSSNAEIDDAERELGSCGVYQSYEGAKGRIKRALFSYFKSYGCFDEDERLTELGRLYSENKISNQEFSFYYVLTYKYEDRLLGLEYFPSELILSCLYKLYEKNQSKAFLSPYDFSKIVECRSVNDINEEFINELLVANSDAAISVNEREIGFDVWAKMYTQAGILTKSKDRNLAIKDVSLIKWILESYKKRNEIRRGEIYTGIITTIPVLDLIRANGNVSPYTDEGKALQAFLFDSVNDNTINKYIIANHFNEIEVMRKALGIPKSDIGFYSSFIGLERLVGQSLLHNENRNVQIVGEILTAIKPNNGKNNSPDLVDLKSYQLIMYGAPGVGKSWEIDRIIKGFTHIRTTFHPDSDYSTFVGAYEPKMEERTRTVLKNETLKIAEIDNNCRSMGLEKERVIAYEFVPQAFIQAYIIAWKAIAISAPIFLIIEEINRGNCAQIFGDLFQLLDRNEKGFSKFPVEATTELANYLSKKFTSLNENQLIECGLEEEIVSNVKDGTKLILPSNLYLRATMNTSDQSLFPIDSAFKRRWDWQYCPIKNEKLGWKIDIGGTSYDWWEFLDAINARIRQDTLSSDKQLGYFFCKPNKGNTITEERFVNKIVYYLWSDVYKDIDDSDLFPEGFVGFFGSDGDLNNKKIIQFLEILGVNPTRPTTINEPASDTQSSNGEASQENHSAIDTSQS